MQFYCTKHQHERVDPRQLWEWGGLLSEQPAPAEEGRARGFGLNPDTDTLRGPRRVLSSPFTCDNHTSMRAPAANAASSYFREASSGRS